MNAPQKVLQPMVEPPLDIDRIRQQFPILHRPMHGKPLVYLDNAASVQKPQAVIDAVSDCYSTYYANIHRGVHYLSERTTVVYEEAREKVRAFLNAASLQEIIFTRGTTESINLVASSFGHGRVKTGDEILITAMEHHSNIVPWQMLCERQGARLRVAPIDDRGQVIMEEYEKLLNERTRLVAVVHVSNALGTLNPVRDMIRQAHARDIPVLVDGAQSAPHMAVDVQALDCDFFCLLGSQSLCAQRHWRAVWEKSAVGFDAPLSGGRGYDSLGDFRKNRVRGPAK